MTYDRIANRFDNWSKALEFIDSHPNYYYAGSFEWGDRVVIILEKEIT